VTLSLEGLFNTTLNPFEGTRATASTAANLTAITDEVLQAFRSPC